MLPERNRHEEERQAKEASRGQAWMWTQLLIRLAAMVGGDLLCLVHQLGLQAFAAMLQAERTVLCRPQYKHDGSRGATPASTPGRSTRCRRTSRHAGRARAPSAAAFVGLTAEKLAECMSRLLWNSAFGRLHRRHLVRRARRALCSGIDASGNKHARLFGREPRRRGRVQSVLGSLVEADSRRTAVASLS